LSPGSSLIVLEENLLVIYISLLSAHFLFGLLNICFFQMIAKMIVNNYPLHMKTDGKITWLFLVVVEILLFIDLVAFCQLP